MAAESFGVDGRLTFKLDIPPLKLGLSQAIPIALIINEGVTNAIKHAFPGNKRGEVFIFMHRTGDRIKLIIADDGVGIDPTAMDSPSGTLGLKLIKGLSEDIDADVHVIPAHGTRITVSFSFDPVHTGNHEDTYSGGSVYRS